MSGIGKQCNDGIQVWAGTDVQNATGTRTFLLNQWKNRVENETILVMNRLVIIDYIRVWIKRIPTGILYCHIGPIVLS